MSNINNMTSIKRLLAFIIDALIVVIVYTGTFYTLNEMGFDYARLLAIINSYIVMITFPVLVWKGQTIGKKILNLKVITLKDESSSRGLLFAREFSKCILFTGSSVILIAILLLFPLLNNKNKAIHDVFCNTIIVDLNTI